MAIQAPLCFSLYVGDLDVGVAENHLWDMFNNNGYSNSILSIRVCRDRITGRSLGYAYVNFRLQEEATKALQKLNYSELNGRPVRIMWSKRDPSERKYAIGNIIVKNLHESIDSKDLHDMYREFGNILSCKVQFMDGKSKGYGYVHFESEESARVAIEQTCGKMIKGKTIQVEGFIHKIEKGTSDDSKFFTNLYIKNLEQDVTEDRLKEMFSEFGKISSLVIMKDENGESKGFGFINFDDPDNAKCAVEKMNGTETGSKCIYVGRAQKKADRVRVLKRQFEQNRRENLLKYQVANVYVKHLDDAVDDEELRRIFGPYGTVISAKVMKDERGVHKGFGFVCFSTPKEAKKAVQELHGCFMHGKPLFVAISQHKEVRHAHCLQKYGPGPVYPAATTTIQTKQGDYRSCDYDNRKATKKTMVHQFMQFEPSYQPPYKCRTELLWPAFQQLNFNNGHHYGLNFTTKSPSSPQLEDCKSPGSTRTPASLKLQKQKIRDYLVLQVEEILWKILLPHVQQYQYGLAAKITRIILEMNSTDLLHLLHSDGLIAKVKEVFWFLKGNDVLF